MQNKRKLSELRYTKENFLCVLDEGRTGNQSLWTDGQIAQWCFLFFFNSEVDQGAPEGPSNSFSLQDLANEVSTQHEADLYSVNPGERVLTPVQYQEWIDRINENC